MKTKSLILLITITGSLCLVFGHPQKTYAAVTVDTTVAGTERTALNNSGTFTSNAITTGGTNRLVLAIIGLNNSAVGAGDNISGVTGGGLTWHLAKRDNLQSGSAEVWYTFAPSILSAVTVTATIGATGSACSSTCTAVLTLIAFSGTDTTGVDGAGAIGATNACDSPSGTPSCALTTTINNSWVLGSFFNWGTATVGVAVGAETVFGGVSDGADGVAFWGQRMNAVTATSGTLVTVSDSAPTTVTYEEAIIEVLPFVAGGGPAAANKSVTARGRVMVHGRVNVR